MDGLVIPTENLERYLPLQFDHGHRRLLCRVVRTFFLGVRKGCSWQQMNCSHRRSDEPLNMTAVMRPPHWAVGQFDPVFLRSTHECMGVKFLGIVEMNSIRDPGNRPLQRVELAICEPSVLRQYALREDRCYGDDARRLQATPEKDRNRPRSVLPRRWRA